MVILPLPLYVPAHAKLVIIILLSSKCLDELALVYNKIYHECDSTIEKSVPRIAVWNHEAYPPTLTRIMDFFFMHTTVCISLFIYFKISFQKSLNTLWCKFTC